MKQLSTVNKTSKKTIIVFLFLSLMAIGTAYAKDKDPETNERYGNTLNVGVGIGYYNYVGSSVSVLHANYEFEVAKYFTLAPFITYYSYREYSYWGDPNHPYRNYSYRETVTPIGVKGSYYFDRLVRAGSKWDFYVAGSLGFAIRTTTWESGYYGETTVQRGTSGVYLDLHIGTEYHINRKIGIYLDLSTGISTIGAAIHL